MLKRASENRAPSGTTGWILGLGVAVGSAGLLWFAATEPFDHGFRRGAELAAVMVASGDWVVQRLADGRLYLDKPPLFAWLIAVPAWLSGDTVSWEAHVPGLLAYALTLLWTGLLARRCFGSARAGWVAALALATTFGFPTLIREKRLDPIFAAWTTGALYFAYRVLVDEDATDGRARHTLAAWLLLALAVLTKGPAALLFVAGAALLFAVWTGRVPRLATRSHALGALLLLVLAASWPLLLVHELGLAKTLEAVHGTTLVTRLGGPLHYLKSSPKLLPWVLLLPALFLRSGPGPRAPLSDPVRFALCVIAAVLIPLELSSGKHYRYLLPAFPGFAILATAALEDPRLPGRARSWRDAVLFGVLALLVLAAIATPVAAVVAGARIGLGLAAACAVALALGVPAGFGLRALRHGDPQPAFALALLALSSLYATQHVLAARHYARLDPTSRLRAALITPVASGVPARTLSLDENGLAFTLLATGRQLPEAKEVGEIRRWLGEVPSGRGIVVTNPDGARALAVELPSWISARADVELGRRPLVVLELTAAPTEVGYRPVSP